MKIGICVLLSLLLLFVGVSAQGDEPTTLTYFVDYEEEQDEDFIEAQVLIQSQSPLLATALNDAKKAAAEVQALATEDCKKNQKKGKGDCKQAVDVFVFSTQIGSYEIEPKYQQVRKQNVFTGTS